MAQKKFVELMNGYVNNQLTQEELTRFLQLIQQEKHQNDLQISIKDLFDDPSVSGSADQGKASLLFQKIMKAAGEQETPDDGLLYLHPKRRVFTSRKIAVAASILLVIGVCWMFFSRQKEASSVANHVGKNTDSLSFVLQREVNTTGTERQIQLPDGSLIMLADKSEITYRKPFVSRDISLIGKAYFKVAKDKTKPFTVTSGEISTTALGTEFTVTAVKFTNQIIVRLYEGKVVVKAIDKTNKRMKSDVYLLPGQQFIYGNQSTEKVVTFKVGKTAPDQILKEERSRDNPSISENVEAPYIMFNNQQLSGVLDDLAALYKVDIIYNKKDVLNIYFIGKYYQSESLENILKRIGTLNNLTITKRDSAFIISK